MGVHEDHLLGLGPQPALHLLGQVVQGHHPLVEGHRAVLGYARHANRGTLPENLLIQPRRANRIGGQ